MMKILITGFSGFVASHFVEFLYGLEEDVEVYGLSRSTPVFNYSKFEDKLKIMFFQIDLMEYDKLKTIFSEIKPDYVLHLAAFSSVAYSWKHPSESFTNNSNIFLNLINAIRETDTKCRILSVGSSEEYGNVNHADLPIRENQEIKPLSPYAVARVSQELMSQVFVDAFGMQIIMTRSFNHIGPRQDERFVIPSFVKRILDIKYSGQTSGEIETGDLSIIRDFVDVRDVVTAYYLLLTKGTPGEIYNICSGRGIRLDEVVKTIAEEVGVSVTTRTNPEYIRPNDNKEIVGSPYKIETELGWRRTRKFRETIHDMIIDQESCR
jgi:GDP-4-dehydro-6-deoxy-D-mannose reductase